MKAEILEIIIQHKFDHIGSDQAVSELLDLFSVHRPVYLTENQISELAQIGSQYLYLGVTDESRISCGGIMEILKMYEEFRKT